MGLQGFRKLFWQDWELVVVQQLFIMDSIGIESALMLRGPLIIPPRASGIQTGTGKLG